MVVALAVIADVALDLVLSGRAGTLHHQRPAVVLVPVLLLGLCLWQTAHQLGRLGQVGAVEPPGTLSARSPTAAAWPTTST